MVSLTRPKIIILLWSVAQGNQGFEGVHQDYEEREEAPPQGRKDHYQEEQENQCD